MRNVEVESLGEIERIENSRARKGLGIFGRFRKELREFWFSSGNSVRSFTGSLCRIKVVQKSNCFYKFIKFCHV